MSDCILLRIHGEEALNFLIMNRMMRKVQNRMYDLSDCRHTPILSF